MAVQKRVRNGKTRWVARYRDPAGREHSRTFETRREATSFLAEQEHAIHAGTWVNPDQAAITVQKLAEAWANQAGTDGTKRVRNLLAKNLGDMGAMPVGKLKPTMVRAWVGHLRNGRPWVEDCEGVSAAYVSSMLHQLKAMLRQAVDDELIAKNPAAKISAPRPDTAVTYADIPSVDEVYLMESAAWNGLTAKKRRELAEKSGGEKMQRYRAFSARPSVAVAIRLGAATGMRAGEVCGLTWTAIDFERGTIHVAAQASRDGQGLMELKTKSAGRRTISVDEETLALLRQHRERLHGSERVIVNSAGTPMSAGVLARELDTLRRVTGVRETASMKSLRHFHATTLLQAGVPVKTVQHRLGHASAVMTLQVYAHFVPADDDSAAGVIGAALADAGQVRDRRRNLRAV